MLVIKVNKHVTNMQKPDILVVEFATVLPLLAAHCDCDATQSCLSVHSFSVLIFRFVKTLEGLL
jgi:hypothetical protein